MHKIRFLTVFTIVALASCVGNSTGEEISDTSKSLPVAESTTVAPSACELGVSCQVGERGPGGGIVFYVDEAGIDPKSLIVQGGVCAIAICRYLEAAPQDVGGNYNWGSAVSAAESYSTDSASDWVLPNRAALNLLCKYVFGDSVNETCNDGGNDVLTPKVTGFSDRYWSSDEAGVEAAWYQLFSNGLQITNDKLASGSAYTPFIRPVRGF